MAPIPWKAILDRLQATLEPDSLPAVSRVARSGRDPFRILVSTMISLRTKDAVTAAATERLLARAPSPQALLKLEEEEIASLIYPAGFYRTKARALKRMAGILLERHAGRVPARAQDLLALPGVGRKTANLVLNLGFGVEAICVDTHVHRISNRLGWVRTSGPAQTEGALMEILPRRYWIPLNELLVRFGQSLCTPVSPRCSSCPIAGFCPRVGVTVFR